MAAHDTTVGSSPSCGSVPAGSPLRPPRRITQGACSATPTRIVPPRTRSSVPRGSRGMSQAAQVSARSASDAPRTTGHAVISVRRRMSDRAAVVGAGPPPLASRGEPRATTATACTPRSFSGSSSACHSIGAPASLGHVGAPGPPDRASARGVPAQRQRESVAVTSDSPRRGSGTRTPQPGVVPALRSRAGRKRGRPRLLAPILRAHGGRGTRLPRPRTAA